MVRVGFGEGWLEGCVWFVFIYFSVSLLFLLFLCLLFFLFYLFSFLMIVNGFLTVSSALYSCVLEFLLGRQEGKG